MEGNNTQTLMHVATELVVVGGLTFWFQRKTSILQEEINDLRNKVSNYENILESQGKLLAEHKMILLRLESSMSLQRNKFVNPNNQQSQSQNIHSMSHSNFLNEREKQFFPQNQRRNFNKDYSKGQYLNHGFEEAENIPEEELDALLGEELKAMNKKSRKKKEKKNKRIETPSFIEIECNEDACEIKEEDPVLKKRSIKNIKTL